MASIIRASVFRASPAFSARTLSTSTVARKDLIQDLYVSQLKAYKAPAQAKDAHAGIVKNFNAPPSPSAPALPSDLAAELGKFDAAEPALVQATVSKPAAGSEEQGGSADEYLTFLEKDLPKAEVHH